MTSPAPPLASSSAPPLATADLAPPRLSEVVLKTSRYAEMKEWYEQALGVRAYFEHVPPDWERRRHGLTERLPLELKLCFIRVAHTFPYSQTVAIFDYPDLQPPAATGSGLHHMQFRNATLIDLLLRYERLAALGVRPYKTFNHGPAMSFYYDDVDGNLVEFSASNFDTEAGFVGFMRSPAFAANPVGVAVDADALLARLKAGESAEQLGRIG
ncbi:MAG: VOC family protein [Lautropia sp.]